MSIYGWFIAYVLVVCALGVLLVAVDLFLGWLADGSDVTERR